VDKIFRGVYAVVKLAFVDGEAKRVSLLDSLSADGLRRRGMPRKKALCVSLRSMST